MVRVRKGRYASGVVAGTRALGPCSEAGADCMAKESQYFTRRDYGRHCGQQSLLMQSRCGCCDVIELRWGKTAGSRVESTSPKQVYTSVLIRLRRYRMPTFIPPAFSCTAYMNLQVVCTRELTKNYKSNPLGYVRRDKQSTVMPRAAPPCATPVRPYKASRLLKNSRWKVRERARSHVGLSHPIRPSNSLRSPWPGMLIPLDRVPVRPDERL
jgi:hypothetical protein